MEKIRIGLIGVGNCASSLVQGIYYYAKKEVPSGLMHPVIGDYRPSDIEVVLAFDIDERKVGVDINEAIFAKPNCTTIFCSDVPRLGSLVQMGAVLDGVSEDM